MIFLLCFVINIEIGKSKIERAQKEEKSKKRKIGRVFCFVLFCFLI